MVPHVDSSDNKKTILNQRIGWIAYIKSWVPPLPEIPSLPSLRLNFSAYFGTPAPKAPVKKAQRYELEAFQDFRAFIDKTLMDFPAMIQLFPDADGESEILNEFEKRMQYGALALIVLGALGFLGFRGRSTGLEFLTNLYACNFHSFI
jgi:hypothetical protein